MAVSILRSRLLHRTTTPFLQSVRSTGFIILLPEIGEEVPGKNPLLGEDGLPDFNEYTIEKCMAVIGKQSWDFEKAVSATETKNSESLDIFQDVIEPLEEAEAPLEFTWGVAKTLYLGNNIMMPTRSYLNIHERAYRSRIAKFYSLPIYNLVKEAKKDTTSYSEEQYRILDKYLVEGKLNCLEGSEKNRDQINFYLQEIQKEKDIYKRNLDYCNNQFSSVIEDPTIVSQFPDSLLRSMAIDKNDPGKGPWKVTLHPNVYHRFMAYCPDKLHRWHAWQAYERRCSSYFNKPYDTSPHVERIRDFRTDIAKVLGYKSFAEMNMETKMANSVEDVKAVLDHLKDAAIPAQSEELQLLQKYAEESLFKGNLERCDIDYWSRKQFKSLYNFNEDDLREYFPLPVVLQGLFDLSSKLFNIRIEQRDNVKKWNKEVQYYDIFEGNSNHPIAGFYLDPYSREEEKMLIQDDIGWMTVIRNRSLVTNTDPLSALIFNFQVPMYGKPSLLSFKELTCLFHKFGHALRHLLTNARYSEVAGISNVEWDATEVCGYFMMHWLTNPNVIKSISKHYANENPLPDHIADNLHNINSHMAGHALCKELYLSKLDLELHHSNDYWRPLMKRVWAEYSTLPLDKYSSHPCTFSKVFLDSWAAGYYSNLWSRMMAADIYNSFIEVGNNNDELLKTGKRYRDTFLALGGGCHPSEVFRRFMGRDYSPTAFLRMLKLDKDFKTKV